MDQTRVKRRVKIVCTIGPASSSAEVIEGMLKAGMDVVRFNLAYGTPAEHARLMLEVHRLSQKLGLPTGILVDLPGPKHRTGDIREIFGEHLQFAVSQEATFIALSLISSAGEVREVKELMAELNADTPIIAKIEKAPAVEDCQAILEACEGIMVARGDLGLQIAIEKVPLAQKRLIREANERGKPVITATQMLESMVQSPTPTRAEAADVANAVLDGTDALMLSEETAIGRYPVEATETMARIALEVDAGFPYGHLLHAAQQGVLPEVGDATARAACQMAEQVGARAIVAFTTGGTTALRVSKYRPRQPIVAVTPSDTVVRRLSLAWGVLPVKGPELFALEELFQQATEVAVKTGVAEGGDLVVITAGLPLAVSGNTNLVKVHELV
jgi:pyruvate kinase